MVINRSLSWSVYDLLVINKSVLRVGIGFSSNKDFVYVMFTKKLIGNEIVS